MTSTCELSANEITHKNTALLIIDMQKYAFKETSSDVAPILRMSSRLGSFLENLRRREFPIAWTKMGVPLDHGGALYPFKPQRHEPIFDKSAMDAFSNPALSSFLDSHKIENVIVTGVHTAYCVTATIKGALANKYRVIVPKDLIATYKYEEKGGNGILSRDIKKRVGLTSSTEILRHVM